MRVVHDIADLQALAGAFFVPTMGALHEGHFTLVREAAHRRSEIAPGAPVVVSIFVNPTQFNDPKDLARYPRTLETDTAGCAAAGADVVFAPSAEAIYPPDNPVRVPELPAVATDPKLEDAHRPGHFTGVCQVVARLFELVRPSAAFFGEKDWQQLQVIVAMTARERYPIDVIPVPTVRESDGLAMSSRNVFLSSDDRRQALALSGALRAARGCQTPVHAEHAMRQALHAAGVHVEYAVVRDASTLLPLAPDRPAPRPARALIAARVGAVRLIDNSSWPL